jgi:hypothetical protein
VDGDHALHLPGVLPDPALRHQDQQVLRPLLLDARHPRLQPRHAHGARCARAPPASWPPRARASIDRRAVEERAVRAPRGGGSLRDAEVERSVQPSPRASTRQPPADSSRRRRRRGPALTAAPRAALLAPPRLGRAQASRRS